MGMVFCRGCGKELHETAPTCPQCGAPQGNLNSVIKDVKESLSNTKESLSKFTHTKRFIRLFWWWVSISFVIILIVLYFEEKDRQETKKFYERIDQMRLERQSSE